MANTKTHWKKLRNNDYLGSWALEPGQDLVATIKLVRVERVTGAEGKSEECTVMHFAEAAIKPMVLNATNQKTMEKLFKTPYIEEWAGRQVLIFVQQVKAFGDIHDALRIRPFAPKTQGNMKCGECGEDVKSTENMTVLQVISWTQNKFGRVLCADCATKAIEARRAQKEAEQSADGDDEDGGNEDESES